jgi:hypothetical protein
VQKAVEDLAALGGQYNRQSTRKAAQMDRKFEWQEQRTTTPDGVYRVLRTGILGGTLRPGEQLLKTHIAADLGMRFQNALSAESLNQTHDGNARFDTSPC